jgi:hypothetical protein
VLYLAMGKRVEAREFVAAAAGELERSVGHSAFYRRPAGVR